MITIDPVSIGALASIIYELNAIKRKLGKTNDKVQDMQDQVDELKIQLRE